MKHKILVVYDVHVDTPHGRLTWAYGRRAQALSRHCPEDFEVEICQFPDIPWNRVREFQLCFNLEYAAPSSREFRKHGFTGPLVISYNSDSNRRREYWTRAYAESDWLIVNNRDAWEFFGKRAKTCVISNGVDTDVFRFTRPVGEREHKCIFAGSSGVTKQKGFSECFWPLEKILPKHGFATDFRPINDINPDLVMPVEKTVEWYNSASYVLCASLSEGTPNLISEGVACGCIAVSLPVGNIQEWGKNGDNCVIVPDRTPEAFLKSLLHAREHRERLSAAGMETIRNGWSYGAPGNRADHYFALFRRLIRKEHVKPFSFLECSPDEI